MDVAVVGGGFTGAAVALTFAEGGVRVAVLDGARVGRGSTASSTALLMQEPDKDFHELSARYGPAAARRIWQVSHAATRDLIQTLKALPDECDLSERDSVYYTLQDAAAGRLRHEYRQRCSAGIKGQWLDPRALASLTGIAGAGAIRTTGNAQVDPYKACLGLLRAAERRGARIFERSAVRRIDTAGGGVAVMTAGGTIHARRVVIATGYATPEFRTLDARFRMRHTFVVATSPLRARTRDATGLGDVMLWDTERPYHYARWTPDGRLLVGGEDRPRMPDRERRRALREGADALRAYIAAIYPTLRHVRTDYAWEGLFAATPDGLPYIGPHRRYPRHLFALGYGGNGMTFGFLAARVLLEQYRGVISDDHRLFAFSRSRRSKA